MLSVDVAINLPVKNLFRQFTYKVPDEMSFLDTGWRVVVPFSSQKTEGFVVRRNSEIKNTENLKSVEAVLGDAPWFDKEMLATAGWLADHYMCSLAEAMRLFVPGKSSIKRTAVKDEKGNLLFYRYEERLKEKTVTAYRITEKGKAELQEGNMRLRAQMAALNVLKDKGFLTLPELAAHKASPAVLRKLLERGCVEAEKKRVMRNSYAAAPARGEDFTLTDEQETAFKAISGSLNKNDGQIFLLQGITGSGKTEIYMRAAEVALKEGKQVLMLVPEIALTAQLVDRFQGRFGDFIAVAHSKLSQNERGDVWQKMRTGSAKILIGVRSAVFAPFKRLGLVIIDEEHEGSYKQEERPNYHARDVAIKRCANTRATLILGSATPALESYHAAKCGKYVHLRLTKRATGSRLPKAEIVDMRRELQNKNFGVLSSRLKEELVKTCAAGEEAIILLNRRGFSTFVMCRDCGAAITCPHCAVALVYHSAGEAMRCHYCGNTAEIPHTCPKCGSRRIKFFGTGTQKAEAEIMGLPEVRVLRMDQDSTMQKFAHADILKSFASGERNVLIGTQMVAKGHDIPNVTLVGVLSADSSLNLPDFRAAERTFSLLTQAAGRAGRGEKEGHVIFQAYDAENPVLTFAAAQDYDAFAERELKYRKELFYPPFSEMLKLTAWDKNKDEALALAKRAAMFIQALELQKRLPENIMVLGPFPSLVPKVRDLYRVNVIIKAEEMAPVKEALMRSEFKEQKNLFFDVDPVSVI